MNSPHSAGGQRRRGVLVAMGRCDVGPACAEALARFVTFAGGTAAQIVLLAVGTSRKNEPDGWQAALEALGAHVRVVTLGERRHCGEVQNVNAVEEATGVFVVSHNPLRMSTVLGGTLLAEALVDRSRGGMPVAGYAAAAAFLSKHMILAGPPSPTPRAGVGGVSPGLGLCSCAMFDVEPDRTSLGGLLAAVAYNPVCVAIRLEPGTAVILDANGGLEVLGANAVTVVDASAMTHSAMGYVRVGEPVALHGVSLHVLTCGARYEIARREALPERRRTHDPVLSDVT